MSALPFPFAVARTSRSLIQVTGRDRHRVINNFFTNQIPDLPKIEDASIVSGPGAEGFVLSGKGKIVAHTFVYVRPDQILIESVSGHSPAIISHIDQFVISEDVEFLDLSERLGQAMVVYGTEAVLRQAIPSAFDEPLNSKQLGESASQAEYFTSRFMTTPSVVLHAAASSIAEYLQEFIGLGAVERLPDEFEADRIRLGYPLFGVDFDNRDFPQELDRDSETISFTKGCYLGQETVARIDALGHVNKHVVSVIIETDAELSTPTEIELDGKRIGTVTSVTSADQPGKHFGIATIRVPHHKSGNNIEASLGKIVVK